MANYQETRVKVRDTQLNKLKYAAKNKTGTKIRLNKKNFQDYFFIRVFFRGHWRFPGQQGKRGNHLLFHSTFFTRSRTLRHLFPTFLVR